MNQNLNYQWRFAPSWSDEYLVSMKDATTIDIPHTTSLLPEHNFDEKIYQKVTTYEKRFDVDESIVNKVVFLCFAGFMVKASIYLNGSFLGEFISGYLPVRIDISSCVQQTNNRLLIKLDSRELDNIPPFGYAIDYLTFGGIYREVSLDVRPLTHLSSLFVSADIDGQVKIESEIAGDLSKKCEITYSIYKNGEEILSSNNNCFSIEKPLLWDLQNPNLYILKAVLKSNDAVDEQQIHFGFRKAEFKQDGFYLNNKRIKLIGLNRHQSYPYIGYAATKRLQEDDALILKKIAGVNVVRTSHYIDSEHFLNKCDEIGLLVIDEVPGWQFVSQKKEWRNNFLDFIQRMIIQGRNHPSIIARGVRVDESKDDHELYSQANKIAHQLDPTRQTLGVRNFKNSELLEDIYAYNDFSSSNLEPGLINPKKVKTKSKPYLVSECLGHMDPTKPSDSIMQRIEHAKRHLKVLDDAYKFDRICGVIPWCFADYNTHADFGSGDRICYHGVFDIFRNPKFAAFAYASQQDNAPAFNVISNMHPGDFPEAVIGKTTIFTNADTVKLFKNDIFVKEFKANRKEFKYLPHPPVEIDDLVGESFEDSRFSKKDNAKFGKLLGFVSTHSFNDLKIPQLLSIISLMMKYKLCYDDIVDLWNKHVASWGGKAPIYTFKAFKKDVLIAEQTFSPSTKFSLSIKSNTTELINAETYDTAKVVIQKIDQNGNLVEYARDALKLSTVGPIEVLGPKLVSFQNGQISIYVRSINSSGFGYLKIEDDDNIHELKFEVR